MKSEEQVAAEQRLTSAAENHCANHSDRSISAPHTFFHPDLCGKAKGDSCEGSTTRCQTLARREYIR